MGCFETGWGMASKLAGRTASKPTDVVITGQLFVNSETGWVGINVVQACFKIGQLMRQSLKQLATVIREDTVLFRSKMAICVNGQCVKFHTV